MIQFFKKWFSKAEPIAQVVKFKIATVGELSHSDFSLLREEYKCFTEAINKEDAELQKKDIESVEKTNTTCPKCSSLHVNNRIQRVEGKIDGSSSGFGSSSLFGGSYMSSGSIHGSIDTNPINKCNDCQNEWQIVKPSYRSTDLQFLAERVCSFMNSCMEVYEGEVTIDPTSLDEKFTNVEDKRKVMIEQFLKSWITTYIKKYFGDYSLELMQYFVKKELDGKLYSHYIDEWNEGDKEYLVKVLGLKSIKNVNISL